MHAFKQPTPSYNLTTVQPMMPQLCYDFTCPTSNHHSMSECLKQMMCCSTWEEMTTDKKHPINQSSNQHIFQDQLTSLQPPCMYSSPQPCPAIMDATLNLDLSTASIPSFATIPSLSASSHPISFPVSHVGCMDTVNGNCVQQHACNPRSASEKTGKHFCHVMSDVFCYEGYIGALPECCVWKICVTDQVWGLKSLNDGE